MKYFLYGFFFLFSLIAVAEKPNEPKGLDRTMLLSTVTKLKEAVKQEKIRDDQISKLEIDIKDPDKKINSKTYERRMKYLKSAGENTIDFKIPRSEPEDETYTPVESLGLKNILPEKCNQNFCSYSIRPLMAEDAIAAIQNIPKRNKPKDFSLYKQIMTTVTDESDKNIDTHLEPCKICDNDPLKDFIKDKPNKCIIIDPEDTVAFQKALIINGRVEGHHLSGSMLNNLISVKGQVRDNCTTFKREFTCDCSENLSSGKPVLAPKGAR